MRQKTTNRKTLMLLLLLLSAGAGFFSFGSSLFQHPLQAVDASAPAVVRLLLPGEPSPDFGVVMEEAGKRLLNELNMRIELKFVPWNDFGRTSQVLLASGSEIDLVFDAPWLHLNDRIAGGFYEPLDRLLAEYGQTVLAKRPDLMWRANRFNGSILAVPLGVSYQMGHSYYVRKDIREQLGVPPIRTYDELIRFAYRIKNQMPSVTPMIAAGSPSQQLYSEAAFRHYDDPTQIRPTHAMSRSLMLYYQGNDGNVHNVLSEKDSPVRGWVADAHKLYREGIMDPNVLGVKDFQTPGRLGRVAIFPTGNLGVSSGYQQKLQEQVPGAEMESLTFFQPAPGETVSNYAQWNFLAVPVASKQKEAAIRFLNWANQKRNYDLLAYGIEGVHWEPVGESKFQLLSSRYVQSPFTWIWNPTDDRLQVGEDVGGEREQFIRDPGNFTPDRLTGFQFDSAPVAEQLNRYARLEAEVYAPLFNGVTDPDKVFPELEEEAGPLLRAIQTELQKQIDDFLTNRQAEQ